MNPAVTAFFDTATNLVSYVVADTNTSRCAVIDSILDFDYAAGRTSTASANLVIKHIRDNNLELVWILETHLHADHLSAAPYIQNVLGGKIGIGEYATTVQSDFAKVFNFDNSFATNGEQFDRLLKDEETLQIGDLAVRVLSTPGHTPACVTYVISDTAFVGDTLFMPDYGTARTDFPGGDAATLYQSIQRILSLPAETRLFVCHDYKPPERSEHAWETTVADQRRRNVHIHDGVSQADFVVFRENRDKELAVPNLIIPSIQVNICGGKLPKPEENGVQYLKIPIDLL